MIYFASCIIVGIFLFYLAIVVIAIEAETHLFSKLLGVAGLFCLAVYFFA